VYFGKLFGNRMVWQVKEEMGY